jgi:outer membrane cobalamin receptor
MRKLGLFLIVSIFLFVQQPPRCYSQSVTTPDETVSVTGSFEPVPLSESNRSVVSFDASSEPELHTSVVEYLQLDPSLDLQERGTGDVQADLSIRGSSFGQTLVLIDGLRINDPQSAHHNLDIPVPTEAISHIEILHGAGSTLYGADAVGGAVNLVTAEPSLTTVRLRTGVGNFGSNDQSLLGSISNRRFSERVAASRDFSTGFEPDRDFRTLSASSETWFRSPLGMSRVLLANSDKSFGADQFYGEFPSWERTKGWLLTANQQIGSSTTLSFGYRRHSDEFILVRGQPAIYENNHVDQSWEFAARRTSTIRKTLTLTYGLDSNGDQIDSNNLGHHGRTRGAGYVNLGLAYWHRLSVSLGDREEIFSGGSVVSSPTIAGGLWVRPSLRFRGSVSRAFRLPSYTDLYYRDPANVGNPDLRPERVWGAEAGPEWTATPHISFTSSFFHRHDADDIDYVKTRPADPWQAMNVQRISFDGLETGLRFTTLNNLHAIQIGYTLIHATQQPYPGVSKYIFNYPSHEAILNWSNRPIDGISLRSRLAVVQRFGIDPYAVWDFAAAVNSGTIRPFLQLSNISGTRYQEIAGVNMPGRGIIGGIEIVWERNTH